MNDMLATIIPKSNQLNADDLIGRNVTIKITKVLIAASAEQPVAVHYEGDDGKPYMCCKSMRRVLVNVWGPDANAYIGKSMTLYRDPNVRFGGAPVGGIRISHMSHIDKPMTMALTETRAQRKPFTVQPLAVPADGPDPYVAIREDADAAAAKGTAAYALFWKTLTKPQQNALLPDHNRRKDTAAAADVLPPVDESGGMEV
jgi:hypothetical protein